MKSELQLFGDESTAQGIVTYGLVAFANKQHARDACYDWKAVLKSFGGKGWSKIHCRTLFSGQARQKTEWAHLTEQDTSELVFTLAKAIRDAGAFFSIGVVHLETWPDGNYPDVDDENGDPRLASVTPNLAYGYGFISAAVGLQSDKGIMKGGQEYKLYLDPLTETVQLFSDWKAMSVLKFFETTGLKPTSYDEKPQLLDSADVVAYATGRALSGASERNKAICGKIHELCNGVRTDFWWNPDKSLHPTMKDKLQL